MIAEDAQGRWPVASSDRKTAAWVTKMRTPVVLLIGLLTVGHAAAQVVTAPRVVDSGEDLFAQKPQSAPPPPGLAPSPATSTAENAPRGANPLWAMPLAGFAVTRERPLFTPSRRPPAAAIARAAPAPVAAPPKPAQPEKPQLALVGTVLEETGAGIGLFMNLADKTPLRLKIGEDHKGWVLRVVRLGQVELLKGRERVVLDLPPPGTTQAAAVPPPAAPGNRPTDVAVGQVGATPSSPDNSPKATSGFSLPPRTGAQPAATIVIQPPVFAPPQPQVNPFQKAGLR